MPYSVQTAATPLGPRGNRCWLRSMDQRLPNFSQVGRSPERAVEARLRATVGPRLWARGCGQSPASGLLRNGGAKRCRTALNCGTIEKNAGAGRRFRDLAARLSVALSCLRSQRYPAIPGQAGEGLGEVGIDEQIDALVAQLPVQLGQYVELLHQVDLPGKHQQVDVPAFCLAVRARGSGALTGAARPERFRGGSTRDARRERRSAR